MKKIHQDFSFLGLYAGHLVGFLAFSAVLNAKTDLANLKVEYQKAPLGVEVMNPRFSWQMVADDSQRGWKQTAYEIIVTDEKGKQVWNSGVVKSDNALNITYMGETLSPTTRYVWSLNVWNQKKEKMTASSSFETGLVMREQPCLVCLVNHFRADSHGEQYLSPWQSALKLAICRANK